MLYFLRNLFPFFKLIRYFRLIYLFKFFMINRSTWNIDCNMKHTNKSAFLPCAFHVPSLEPLALIKFEPAKSIQWLYKLIIKLSWIILASYIFLVRVFFQRYWRFTRSRGRKGTFLPFPSAQFRYSFKTAHVRWLPRISNEINSLRLGTQWDLPP